MITHSSKKILFVLTFLVLFFATAVLHNNIVRTSIDEKLQKLHASGIYVKVIDEEESILSTQKSFHIRLEKIELIADLILGIRTNDPILVHLLKLQGLELTISLTHTKYLFSNSVDAYINIENLPEYFENQSQLLSEVLAFSKNNPKLISAHYNMWDNSFQLHISKLDKRFTAEHNFSYDLAFHTFELSGSILDHAQYSVAGTFDEFHLSLNHFDQLKNRLDLQKASFKVDSDYENITTQMAFNSMLLLLESEENSTIALHNFHSNQQFKQEENKDLFTTLSFDKLDITTPTDKVNIKEFHYDIDLSNLHTQSFNHLSDLIHTSNTNSVSFIVNDLSDDILSLIKNNATLHLKEFSFKDLVLNEKHFHDAKVSLHVQSDYEHETLPVQLTMDIHLSHDIYSYFLDNVPNASFTKYYLDQNETYNASFHLELTPDGFMLNGKEIYFDPIQPDANESNRSKEINFL